MAQPHRLGSERSAQDPVTVDDLKSELSQLASTVQKLAADQFGEAAEAAQQQAANKVSDLEVAIRKNPTQAAAVAAGIGFLIGLVLTR
jgi:ElaB/YqjD/DUF883 family membrane-anchored ribosome-binding protein